MVSDKAVINASRRASEREKAATAITSDAAVTAPTVVHERSTQAVAPQPAAATTLTTISNGTPDRRPNTNQPVWLASAIAQVSAETPARSPFTMMRRNCGQERSVVKTTASTLRIITSTPPTYR
jgi:hypothetical protein